MAKDTVFQCLFKPLTKKLMEECNRLFKSDYDCVSFNTFAHLQTMVFAHVCELKSLRTLEVAMNSQQIGLACKVSRSTLSDANCRRSADCFFWILEQLMFFLPRKIRKDFNRVVKLLDSTPIKLKGLGYDEWVKQYATAHWQGLKLHVELDLEQECPTQVAMSYANYNDSTMGKRWKLQSETIYVFDKGYCDYNWWWSIEQKKSYFVTRLKENASIVMKKTKKSTSEMILKDGMFQFKNKNPRGGKKNLYAKSLRRIVVKREGKKPLILVTNLLDVSAEMVAELYKARWEIELFFKWIKQNLKIKKFFGRSANAVKIQIATALIGYLLVQLFKNSFRSKHSLRLVLVWIRFNLTDLLVYKIKDPPLSYTKCVHANSR